MIEELSQKLLNSQAPLRIHLIGVAGSGMSGLASLLLGMGHRVSGSDRVTSGETQRMQNMGLHFTSPHLAECVHGADVVVYSSAIRSTNPARMEAERLNIPAIRRAECLAAILKGKEGIVISGTHGKTTTSAMCAHIMRRGGIHPSHYVGAEIPVLGVNAHWDDKGQAMVAEGDESDGTLALYTPKHAVVLNIEEEHLDHYKDLEHIKTVFQTLLKQTSGSWVYCQECPVARELCATSPQGVSYGWEEADYTASNVLERSGIVAFDVHKKGDLLGRVELGVPGRHNALNALAAIAIADIHGVSFEHTMLALSTFAGARRRFETKYLSEHLRVIDDYGHHPTEIAATIQTARSLDPKRLVVVFQPHRYSRTQKLADDFGAVLQQADRVFITDIYPASEQPIEGVSAETIAEAMARHGSIKVECVGAVAEAHHQVGNALRQGDMLITLGAGNVHEIGTKITRDIKVLDDMERVADDIAWKLYEPMSKHTTILVGGPAQFWIEPSTFQAFGDVVKFCRERGIPIRVVGRGSNLLVRQGGIRGGVVHPKRGEFSEISVSGNTIRAGAGVRFKKVASVAQVAGLTGFEWMEGIPGNVGGGLRMNAGAMGWETFDQVVDVTFLDEDGEIHTRSREEIEAFYRNVPELRRHFALAATFEGKPAQKVEIESAMRASKNKRQTSQPVAASAGCIFKNPEAMPAGKLVDDLGMKGKAYGKARVSPVHGNFIVNEGKASAQDVLGLIEQIQSQAVAEYGIELDTEVQIIGEDVAQF